MNGINIGWKNNYESYSNFEWKTGSVYRDLIYSSNFKPYLYNGDGHLITFAPTGSGKGVSCVIPTLLDYPGSTIILDPKGENYAVTSRYRSEVLGQKIYAFDPYNVGGSWGESTLKNHRESLASINPFDLLCDERDSPGARARVMANALIPVEGLEGEDRFWAMAAQNLLAGLIAHTIEDENLSPENKNLVHVAEIIVGDVVGFVLEALSEDEEAIEESKPQKLSFFTSKAFGNFINIGAADKARDSVIFVLNTYIENLLTDEISNVLKKTNIDFHSLRNLSVPYSLYLIVPPEKLQSDSNVLRLMITSILKIIISRRKNPKLKELFILDECAQLGEMNELRQVVTLLRGYGVLAWMFFQDLSQLKTTYKDWESIINNCGMVQVFGYGRLHPAKQISELLGHVSPEEVMKLGKRRQIISAIGEKTKIVQKLNYLNDRYFENRFCENPYHITPFK